MRMGVIGCGQFMSRQHIQTIARSERLSLHHLADRDPAALARMTERYAPTRTSTIWEAVVADAEVDVVVAGIVPKYHAAIVRACLEAGKPVYIEKPVTDTLEEGLALAAASRGAGVPVAVGFNRRFAPATEVMSQAFGAADGPVSVYYRISDDARVRPPSQDWKLADRLLIEVVHIFDLLHHLIGAEPVELHAVESRPNDGFVTLSYGDGSHACIFSSSYGSMAQCKEHLEAELDNVSVEMDDFVEVRVCGGSSLPTRSCFAGRPYDGCDSAHVRAFADRGAPAYLDLRQRYAAALENSGVLADSGSAEAWDRFAELSGAPPWPQINYCPDKGWGVALESFCAAVAAGDRPTNADLTDINRATACALAGRESIRIGGPVAIRMDSVSWGCST